ncbi:unnamed protein product [Paramecium octaurelia]|uniref:Uncharacterized protein n=1 Tax=Paramecium octaurelia TaxID=43137 RepID=A0A8S1XRL7_PAROT|nr:unnamed protein product [Paramecium octaurelia]
MIRRHEAYYDCCCALWSLKSDLVMRKSGASMMAIFIKLLIAPAPQSILAGQNHHMTLI